MTVNISAMQQTTEPRAPEGVALLGKDTFCSPLQLDDTLQSGAQAMADHNVEFLPVVDQSGQLAGVLSYRAVIRMVAQGDYDACAILFDHIEQDMTLVEDQESIVDAMRLLLHHKTRCVVVVRDGQPTGILEPSALLAHAHL